MAFILYNVRKRLHYFAIFAFGIAVFLFFSWRHIWNPHDFDNGQKWVEENPLPLKSSKKTSSTKLFNLNFRYILSADSCSNDLLAVIIVTSHYNNVETRSSMRRAFSGEELAAAKMKRVFLLGQTADSVYMTQASILHESKRFGDIIQGNFQEAYRNLTYKHVMGLKWVSENCQSAKYVIKMDDDIVFNIQRIIDLLNDVPLPKNSISGYILRDLKPIREPANKWYVTQEEYQFSKYPSFVSGWFYVTTPKIASKLVLLSHYFKYFWIDDVYVTGVLTKNLKIKLYELRKYFTLYAEFLRCCISGVKKRLECDILVGPNGGDNNLFYEFNEAMKICEFETCNKRLRPMNETCVAEKKINLRGGSGIIESYKLH
ncbi:hypothetical protein Zmor_010383 [Zophobas morio]|uniref:Hexosyltransferase n=1 Tax=Zophobas morio TaxID=2755281 RepID=A0AA38MJX7_9CUCU|nr:hypothetical protein Zmor_010383 [Zophobas morio]